MKIRLSGGLVRIAGRCRRLGLVLLTAIGLGLLDFEADHILLGFNLTEHQHSAFHAMIVGPTGAAALYLILKGYEARRRMQREEIRKVAELNHHLRNWLEVIADAHYFGEDLAHKQMILESVKKIDEELRHLFPAKD